MASDPVGDYYASFGEREWARLENPDDGVVEYTVTKHIIAKYLPYQARVLDIGGGVIVVNAATERLDIKIIEHAVRRADDMRVVKKCRSHQVSVARFGGLNIWLQGFLHGPVFVKALRFIRSSFD